MNESFNNKDKTSFNLSANQKRCNCFCAFSLLCGSFFCPLSLSLKDRCQSLCLCLCLQQAHKYWFYFLSTCLFGLHTRTAADALFYGVIIILKNSSHTDLFSNILEMSPLLGLPYIRMPHYFNRSSLCILHLHMDRKRTCGETKRLGLTDIFCAADL